ncbi:SRPBCC family protein [Paenibacillus sp. y28]|uniref:SRPBCC family protein n=1 Tax=Paenibacillus sp. y28 TaxID=3129110 RepID=UPI003016117D
MSLNYEFYIGAEPEQVWAALVSPEGTRQTFFGCVIRSTFREGDAFEYIGPGKDGEATVHVYGTILACVPNQMLSYIEHPGPSYYANHAELESRVTFTLEQTGGCTKLKLVNDRFSDNHPSYGNAEKHWWMILSHIKTWVETGKSLDFGW